MIFLDSIVFNFTLHKLKPLFVWFTNNTTSNPCFCNPFIFEIKKVSEYDEYKSGTFFYKIKTIDYLEV